MDFQEMFARLITKKTKTREEQAHALKEKLMKQVLKGIGVKGQENIDLGLRLCKELIESSTMMKATPEVMEGFTAGILFASKQVEDHLDGDDADVEGVQTRLAMTTGMVYKLIADAKGPAVPVDHKHGGEPIFRKRTDGTPFCIVCDENVTEEEIEAAKK